MHWADWARRVQNQDFSLPNEFRVYRVSLIMTRNSKCLMRILAITTIFYFVNAMPRQVLAFTGNQKKTSSVKYYTVRAGQKLRVRMDQELSSKNARAGDTFTGTIVDPVYSSGGTEVIPAGSHISGRITAVQKSAKNGNPGTLSVSFYRVELPNGRSKAISGSLTSLDTGKTQSDEEGNVSGKKTKNRNLKWIGGGTGGGAVIGALAGGGKGALIGGAVGAAGGFIGKKLTKGKEAEIKEGTEFGVYLNTNVSLPAYKH